LETPHPDIVSRVNDVLRQVSAEGGCELTADGTGVSRPVVDLLRRTSSQKVFTDLTKNRLLSDNI
jgi:hypothetical protein